MLQGELAVGPEDVRSEVLSAGYLAGPDAMT